MTRRGKRRTRSQRIGEKGEALYRAWAVDNGLTSQKIEQDYGVDFFSQIFRPVDSSIEEVTGSVLAVQVRSVEGIRRKRVKLDRTDAENALRLRIPYCLVAIDVVEDKVYHRFLDEGFLLDLDEFLHSSRQNLTMGLNSFAHGSDRFRTDLALASEQGYQYRLRILNAEHDITSDIPGTTINVVQDSGYGAAKVNLPWITQAFSVGVETQDEAAKFVFEKGVLPPPNHPNIRLREVFRDVADIASGPLLLQGSFEEERSLFVEYQGNRAVAPFALRRIGDERAYIGESGLVLIISDPRHVGGLPSHQLSISLNRVKAKPLLACTTSKNFLKMLRPGAILNEEGREGISISNWPNLERIGPAVDAIFSIADQLSVELQDAILADISDEGFGRGISLLDAVLAGVGIERLVPAFLAGPAREQPYSEHNWKNPGSEFLLCLISRIVEL